MITLGTTTSANVVEELHAHRGGSFAPWRRTRHWIAASALAALVWALAGCTGGESTGAGSVDLSRAKEAASSSPDVAASPAAAARGGGGIGGAQKNPPKKGRR